MQLHLEEEEDLVEPACSACSCGTNGMARTTRAELLLSATNLSRKTRPLDKESSLSVTAHAKKIVSVGGVTSGI